MDHKKRIGSLFFIGMLFFAVSATAVFGLVEPGHQWGPWIIDKAPTCTQAGSEHRTCTHIPNEPHSEYRAIPALGHKWGSWFTVRKATSEREGLKERICQRCGAVQKKSIPKLPAPAAAPTVPAVTPTVPPATKPAPAPAPAPKSPVNGLDILFSVMCLAAAGSYFGVIRYDYKLLRWHQNEVIKRFGKGGIF